MKPIKIIQFGEGNFLRAFADYLIYLLNHKTSYEGGVAVVQPIENGLIHLLEAQDGQYTHFLNGIKQGEIQQEVILNDVIQKSLNPYENFEAFLALACIDTVDVVISNTTEAGITFIEEAFNEKVTPQSYPGKLTRLLLKRYEYCQGDENKGFSVLPCELINHNGVALRNCVMQYIEFWGLDDAFKAWVEKAVDFSNTLVDRIVTGYPKDRAKELCEQIGREDSLLVESEVFLLWTIEANERTQQRLPLESVDAGAYFVEDIQPYRTRKVRILNGLHTSMVPVGLLANIDTVRETVENDVLKKFLNQILVHDIMPTIDMPQDELESFAEDVMDRFRNPFIRHELVAISLNSVSKYKTRVLPSALYHLEKGRLPKGLLFALSSLIVYYKGACQPLRDSEENIEYFNNLWATNDVDHVVKEVLSNETLWAQDLTAFEGVLDYVSSCVKAIEENDMMSLLSVGGKYHEIS